jgi:hypothetical protein
MVMIEDMGASGKPDRAVVNGAGRAVSALRASVPSALKAFLAGAVVFAAYAAGHVRGFEEGGAQMRDAILCVGLSTVGDADASNRRYCNKLGVDFSRGQAQAIEARGAETQGGSAHQ